MVSYYWFKFKPNNWFKFKPNTKITFFAPTITTSNNLPLRICCKKFVKTHIISLIFIIIN